MLKSLEKEGGIPDRQLYSLKKADTQEERDYYLTDSKRVQQAYTQQQERAALNKAHKGT